MINISSTTASPEVSVIMAVYNAFPYLEESIDSILKQSFSNFEFIIIDDGSNDGSSEILESYALIDNRIRLIKQEENRGLVNALNKGIGIAKGKYIARMDADDISYNYRLAKQVTYIKKNKSVVLLSGSFDYISTKGNIIKRKKVITSHGELLSSLIYKGNQFCHPCAMMKRKAVVDLGGYRAFENNFAEDYDLWLRLSEVGQVANIATPLLAYRVHNNQISHKNLFFQRRSAEICKNLAHQRRNNGCEDLAQAIEFIDRNKKVLMEMVASDYIFWSAMYYRRGDIFHSSLLLLKAITYAPFSLKVRTTIEEIFKKFILT